MRSTFAFGQYTNNCRLNSVMYVIFEILIFVSVVVLNYNKTSNLIFVHGNCV